MRRPIRSLLYLLGAGALLAALLGGCGAGRQIVRGNDPCVLLPGQPVAGGRLHFALADSIDPRRQAFPANDSEHLLFRQLYESLLDVACDGSLRPALASEWRREGAGWLFTIRPGACFWDGEPVEASDLLVAWMAVEREARRAGGHLPCRAMEPLKDRVRIVDERHLLITPRREPAGFPRQLAAPAFAVGSERPLLHWRLGSGPLRPRGLHVPPGGEIVCHTNRRHPEPSSWDEIVFTILAGIDPRSYTYEGADAFVLRDRRVLPLFRGLPDLEIVSLTWDRLYLLVLPRGGRFAELLARELGWYEDLQSEVNEGLILHAQALAATPSWLREFLPDLALVPFEQGLDEALFALEPESGPELELDEAELLAQLAINPRILYPADDEDARELASRIASLGSRARGGAWPLALTPRVSTMSEGDFARALRASCETGAAGRGGAMGEDDDAIFVLPLRRGEFHPERLGEARLLPLALSRASLVARSGLVGVEVDVDGTPLLNSAGWRSDPDAASTPDGVQDGVQDSARDGAQGATSDDREGELR